MGTCGPQPTKGKPTTIRLEPDLRERLEEARTLAGRASLSEEIVTRLHLSLDRADIERDFGDAETYALARLIGWALLDIKRDTGHAWFEHPWAFKHATDAVITLLSYFRPFGRATVPDDVPVLQALRSQGLGEIVENARKKLEGYQCGVMGGQAAIALLEAAAQSASAPELKKLKPVAALLVRRLRENNADGQALIDMNAAVQNGKGGLTL